MKRVNVGGMSESVYGIQTLQKIKSEALGDYTVLFCGPWSREKIEDVVAFCKANNMKFVMDETFDRLSGVLRDVYADFDAEKFRMLIRDAGVCFDGSLFMCEFGGMMLYWPINFVKDSENVISPTGCALTAKQDMLKKLRLLMKKAEGSVVVPPLVCIEASGGMSKYLYEAGFDRVDLEVTYDRFTEFYYSATKGSTIAYGKDRFGVDMAMVWYGGNSHDKLWFKRWRTSLFHAFIRGADPIYTEHGLMDYKALGKNLDSEAEEVKEFRKSVGELAQLAANHPRPSGFPKARIAVAYGNLDSFAMGQPYVWGQRGENNIPSGAAEHAWELFNTFYQKVPWDYRYAVGDADCSGNPPLGQVDVVPAESPVDVLRRYDVIIFLGWNSMTPEIYANLMAFVESGGHLLCTLAHLCTNTRRDEPLNVVNGGDLRDLFGVQVEDMERNVKVGIKFKANPSVGNYNFPLWSAVCDPKYYDGGFRCAGLRLEGAELLAAAAENFADTWEKLDQSPVLTGNRIGQGMAFLLNSLDYPGYHGLRRLYQDLLRFFAAAWQKDLRVETSDRVRFAVYNEGDMEIIYLLNTDPSCSQEARVQAGKGAFISIPLQSGELRICYRKGFCAAVPENNHVGITGMELQGETIALRTYDNGVKPGIVASYYEGRSCNSIMQTEA